jgi:hypothetical protein
MKAFLLAAYTSYFESGFEATCSFYEMSVGCTPAHAWDRADSRGVYYDLDGSPAVEILDTSRGEDAPRHRRQGRSPLS